MQYALINRMKVKPAKGLRAYCIGCGQEMISKCGSVKLHHWAHKGKRNCDPWWENETKWHRDWKSEFPVDWQEVPHRDEFGEMHIADVKRPDGFYIEFQHSPISQEEIISRNQFYINIVWVIDGCRLKSDVESFKFLKTTISS